MLPVDMCHLKQTVLIRSSTKCKYQSGQPQRTPRKTHYMRQNTVSSTLLAQVRYNMRNVVWILPEMTQLQNKTGLKAFLKPSLWFGGPHSWCGAWPKTSVMNASLQQQMSIHNSWGWIWVYSRIAFGQSVAKDSVYPVPRLNEEIKHLVILNHKCARALIVQAHGCTCSGCLNALWQYWLRLTLKTVSFPFFPLQDRELQYCALFLTLSLLSIASDSPFPLEKKKHFQHWAVAAEN